MTPKPMPNFASLLRPGLVFGGVGFVAEAAAVGVPGRIDNVDACLVVGVDAVIAATIDDDHVVAERSDLLTRFSSQLILFEITSCQNLFRVGGEPEQDALQADEEARAIGGIVARDGLICLIQVYVTS